MSKILIIVSHYLTIYSLRKEFVIELLDQGYDVTIAMPDIGEASYFEEIGCKLIETRIERRSTNVFQDFKLFYMYMKIMKNMKPDIVLTYTIKPNIYGGIASRLTKTKALHTVTGIGSVYIKDMWIKKITIPLNKLAFKNAEPIFFLNEENKEFYKKMNIIEPDTNIVIVPGSGVNLNQFSFTELKDNDKIIFTFVGRIIKDKGIEEFLSAAKSIKKEFENIIFNVVGFLDDSRYDVMLKKYESEGIIRYWGRRDDVSQIMVDSTCIVLPSYGEGRGTVLQEGAAIGRPLITTNSYGCKENVIDGYNGFLCEIADSNSLYDCFKRFIRLTDEERIIMGRNSRIKAEAEFDRKIVVRKYIKEIENYLK